MALHLVLGAGPLGATVARALLERGEAVRLATRSGADAGLAGVEAVRLDVADAAELRAAAAGAAVAYFAVSPGYTEWGQKLLPMVDGTVAGLRGSGVRLVVADNLYLYDQTGGAPIREESPVAPTTRKGRLRAEAARRFLAAHARGEVEVAIGRGSDYFGPRAVGSHLGERFFAPLLAGRAAEFLGDPDLPHTYTYVPDFAAALVALGERPEAVGRAWHVPSPETVTTREIARRAAALAGVAPRLRPLRGIPLALLALFVPLLREVREMQYQREAPYVVDASAWMAAFGGAATSLDEALAATVAWFRERPARA